MNFTVVLSSCVAGVLKSFTVDARILTKRSCIRKSLNKVVTARFCTSSGYPQLTSRDDDSESDSDNEVGETRSLTNKFLVTLSFEVFSITTMCRCINYGKCVWSGSLWARLRRHACTGTPRLARRSHE